MTPEPQATLAERFFLLEEQEVALHDFPTEGWILDVGGGGEGVIGILKSSEVVAIDLWKSELEEAPAGPLKIIMDARELQFLDESFDTVTAFYALMYLKSVPDYEKVFAELYRVLRPGGRFLIWDTVVPERPEGEERPYLVLVKVAVQGQLIETGYARQWPEEAHDLGFYRELAEKSGFVVVDEGMEGQALFLRLQRV